MCDGRGDPCDSRCGGGGCGRCGGTSCDEGAVIKSGNAKDLARRADAELMEKQAIVSDMLRDVSASSRTFEKGSGIRSRQ